MNNKKLKLIAWIITLGSIFGLVRTVFTGAGVASGLDAEWLLPLSIFFIVLPVIIWAYYAYKVRSK